MSINVPVYTSFAACKLHIGLSAEIQTLCTCDLLCNFIHFDPKMWTITKYFTLVIFYTVQLLKGTLVKSLNYSQRVL